MPEKMPYHHFLPVLLVSGAVLTTAPLMLVCVGPSCRGVCGLINPTGAPVEHDPCILSASLPDRARPSLPATAPRFCFLG